MKAMKLAGCPLCDGAGGAVIFQGPAFRLVRADEPGFPAFYRLVWTGHAVEFSDLDRPDRIVCMEAVVVVERVLRDLLRPAKINLATLGNMVGHLHWHIVARFDWDSHYPSAVWAPAQREAPPGLLAQLVDRRPLLEARLASELARLG